MKAPGSKTITEIIPSPRSDVEDIEPISESSQSQLRPRCLERDGNEYIATGLYSHTHAHPRSVPTTILEAACIIPFVLWSNSGEVGDRNAKVWVNLRCYFPALHNMSFTPEQINSEKNVLMLDSLVHKEFGQFRLIFVIFSVTIHLLHCVSHQFSFPASVLPRERNSL